MRTVIAILCLLLTGCSAKAKLTAAISTVQAESAKVAQHLGAASADLTAALETGDVGPLAAPLIESAIGHIAGAAASNEKINGAAVDGQKALPGVVDEEGWFANLLRTFGWLIAAVILAAVCFLVWRFWPVIQVFVGWIPAIFRRKAAVAADFVADKSPPTEGDIETARIIEKSKSDPRFKVAFDAALTERGIPT